MLAIWHYLFNTMDQAVLIHGKEIRTNSPVGSCSKNLQHVMTPTKPPSLWCSILIRHPTLSSIDVKTSWQISPHKSDGIIILCDVNRRLKFRLRSAIWCFSPLISAATSLKYPWRVISEKNKLDKKLIFKEPKDKTTYICLYAIVYVWAYTSCLYVGHKYIQIQSYQKKIKIQDSNQNEKDLKPKLRRTGLCDLPPGVCSRPYRHGS